MEIVFWKKEIVFQKGRLCFGKMGIVMQFPTIHDGTRKDGEWVGIWAIVGSAMADPTATLDLAHQAPPRALVRKIQCRK